MPAPAVARVYFRIASGEVYSRKNASFSIDKFVSVSVTLCPLTSLDCCSARQKTFGVASAKTADICLLSSDTSPLLALVPTVDRNAVVLLVYQIETKTRSQLC